MAQTFHPGVLVPQTLSLEQLHQKQPEKETPISKLHVLVKLNLHHYCLFQTSSQLR